MRYLKRSKLHLTSLVFLSLSIVSCLSSATRNYVIGNPIGVAINLSTFVFLLSGMVAVWLDRKRPSIESKVSRLDESQRLHKLTPP